MNALKKILDLRSSFPHANSLTKEGMAKGKKVCGWICMQVPEEIIEAGNMLPVRILGDNKKDTSIGDAHLHTNNCPYTRACMSTALRGDYKYFDAVIAGNLCDHVRRFGDEYRRWVHDKDDLKYFFFWVPFKSHDRAVKAYREQLVQMVETIESASGKKITNEELNKWIDIYEETRKLLRQVAEFRKLPQPPITGSEFMEVVLAAQQSPKVEYNEILKELIAELANAPGKGTKGGPRVVMFGSELDDPSFVKVIENAGANVVADDLCTGNAYFWHNVEPVKPETANDPLLRLAKRYITGIVCPRMTPPVTKHDLQKYMLKSFKADAVIYTVLKFCEPHITHWQPASEIVKEVGLPILWLEREYMSGGSLGQVKTRVEAFMEQLLDI